MSGHKLGARVIAPKATTQRLQLATPNLSKFDRLSRSLDEFGGNVAGLAIKAHEDAAQKDREAGAEAAAKEIAAGRTTEKEMVDAKILTRGESSFFRDGALEQMGRAHAAAFSNAIIIAAAERGLGESIIPEEMGEVIAEVAKDFNADDQGAAFSNGFAAEAADVALGFEQRHAAQVAANLESGHNDEVTNKYRARSILALEGADPSVVVANLFEALQAESELHLAIIPDPGKGDFKRSNRALTDTLISLIDDGTISGAQAIEVLKKLHTPSGSLFAMAEHAPRVEQAWDNQITRETGRDANTARLIMKKKQENGSRAAAEMFANADEKGKLDMTAINLEMAKSLGQAFTPAYIERMQRAVNNAEIMAEREYLSDRTMLGDYTIRIMEGEHITAFQLAADTNEDGLNPSDAARLFNSIEARRALLASDPVLAQMDSEARFLIKTGLGGFAGREFGSQAWANASVEFQEEFNLMKEENPSWTAASPEFRDWALVKLRYFQQKHLTEGEWGPLQRGAALRTAIFETEPYQTTLFENNEQAVINMYAQALEWQENGREMDDSTIEFFNAPDRHLSEEGALNPNNYVVGLEGQLLLMGVDPSSDDRINAARRLLQFRPRAGTEAGASTAAPVKIVSSDTVGADVIAMKPEDLMKLLGTLDSAQKADGATDEDGNPVND